MYLNLKIKNQIFDFQVLTFHHKFTLIRKFVDNPNTIGSIYPSSKYLVEKILRQVDFSKTHNIAELGAGTGAITKQLIKKISTTQRLLLVEQDTEMRTFLRLQFPKALINKDAQELTGYARLYDIKVFDSIISGIPFIAVDKETRENILDEVVKNLSPDGTFVLFQYSWFLKKELQKRFEIVETYFELRNLPPAIVYVCKKPRK